MKKYLLISLLALLPFMAKAETLAGFLDGNMYDISTGQWRCFYLMDGNCYDVNQNILATRPTSTVPTVVVPPSTPQTNYVPLYLPQNTGANSYTGGSPIVGGITQTASCTITATNLQPYIPIYNKLSNTPTEIGRWNELVTWTSQGLDTSITGTLYHILDTNGGVQHWEAGSIADNSSRISDETGTYFYGASNTFYPGKVPQNGVGIDTINQAPYKLVFSDGTTCTSN